MRQIKFRAWNENKKEYFEYTDDLLIALSGKVFENVYGDSSEESLEQRMIPSEYTIEQFTGLRSISGKYIYEGDIVNIIDDGREYKSLTIKYSDERCGFIAENEEWKKFLYQVEFIEIVGNINC